MIYFPKDWINLEKQIPVLIVGSGAAGLSIAIKLETLNAPSITSNSPIKPLVPGNPKAANVILSLLKKINKEFGTTILCNLHQVDLAKKYSDRLVGLLDGKIIFDEKSENINKSNLEKIYV